MCSIPKYYIINLTQLFKKSSSSQLYNQRLQVPSTANPFALYILKGNNENLLHNTQAKRIYDIISNDPLQTSCLIYDQKEVQRKFDNWNKNFPWIRAHYAIKANPTRPILEDLHGKGAGFDCASRAEIETVLSLGVDKASIVYSNPIKDEKELIWAGQNGIPLTTADCIQELLKIQRYTPNIDVLWRISIIEAASDNLSTPFSGKFGDDIDSEEKIHQRMAEIQALGITLKGIHFHCGSGLHGSSAFGRAVDLARNCLRIGRLYGHQMSIMDIGGGFSSKQINSATIEALKTTENDPLDYRVIAEPGRHFCSNAFYLLTRVLCKKTKNSKTCYHLNESLYHSFNCNLMDDVSFQNKKDIFYMKIQGKEEAELQGFQDSTFFGMTCDGLDVITRNIGVPKEMRVGDWLCFSGMGAYTYGSRSNFNGMKSIQNVHRLFASSESSLKEQTGDSLSEQTLSSEQGLE